MSQKYQLVLQWPASTIKDYDAMIALEDLLIRQLPDEVDVDGHDIGSGETNIFIHTDTPVETFEAARAILDAKGAMARLKAGYRDFDSDDYEILWPEGLTSFEIL